jgi:glycosyltransferase involved in cell wall biosynthesis
MQTPNRFSDLKDLSLVIPCFNSESYLANNVIDIINELNFNFSLNFEILLVVDGSPDKTIQIAKRLATDYSEIRAIELTKNFGQHAALFAGISQAQGNLIITLDDDGQHTPAGISKLLSSLKPEFDVVYGIADKEEHNFLRNFLSILAKQVIFRVLGIKNARHISAFRLVRHEILRDVDFTNLSRGTLDVVIHWNTNRISWVKVKMLKRPHGRSNYRLRELIHFGLDMITNYSTAPLRFATFVGVIGFVASCGLAFHFGTESLSGNITVPGYASLSILITALGSIQLMSLGILGEYLSKIHEKSSSRPTFTIRETWN